MAKQLGVCPVALARQHDGVNGGQAAGRVCWCIKETGNRLARTLDTQHNGCQNCHFFQRVTFEEQTEAKGRLTLTNV